DIKSEKDLGTLTQQLIKLTVETALNAEMDEHLGYEKHAPQGRGTGNNRNGYSTKRLKGQHGEVTIQAPRDRNASFEPQFVRKGQSRLTQMDDQILALYAKGLSTRDIVDAFKEMYDADISAGLVSKVTERVIEQVHEWQNRPLDPNLITLFDYPPAIRKVIYTTNAIESLNSVLRKATKQRKLFPTDESALKVAFLAIQQASKKWTMPIQNWKPALNRFIIEFGDRLNGHL
ncbi:transposase, partial [Aeromonas salmonicida]|uniref:transposase n=1 Tax=Aeromonas salmonicida TaxID=645 RepID=UPI000CC59846